MTAGDGCTPTGASCLSFATCNRDKLSAKTFFTPETRRARNKILHFKHARTSRRTNIIKITSREVALFIISTNAAFPYKRVCWLRTHTRTLSTIGKNSKIVILNCFQFSGHPPKDHSRQRLRRNPNYLLRQRIDLNQMNQSIHR